MPRACGYVTKLKRVPTKLWPLQQFGQFLCQDRAWGLNSLIQRVPHQKRNRSAHHTQCPGHVGGDMAWHPQPATQLAELSARWKCGAPCSNIWISKQWEPSTILSVGLHAPMQPMPTPAGTRFGTFCSKLRSCVFFLTCSAVSVRNTKSVLRSFSRIQILSFT